MAAALLDDAQARIHQHDREIRGRGAGDHVAGVLHVAGRVGDDEFAARRGEVAVGDVDGDALLALGAKTVGEIGEIDLAAAGDVGGALERLELVFHQRLRIVEQPADERGLAVIHRAAGVEAEKIDGMMQRDGHAISKVADLLAVFHGGFGGFVVGAGAAFGDARGGDFGDDVVDVVGGRFDTSGADDVADGADADDEIFDLLAWLWRHESR